jgi:hypothetical protein
MKRKSIFALGALAVYCSVIGLAPLPDRLILFPSTSRIYAGAAKRTALAVDGGELEIWTATSRLAKQKGRADAYLLRFYGNADRAEYWVADEAEMWEHRAIEVGDELPRLWRKHWTGPPRAHRTSRVDCV